MEKLSSQICVACKGGIPPMDERESAVFLKRLNEETRSQLQNAGDSSIFRRFRSTVVDRPPDDQLIPSQDWEVVENHHLKQSWEFDDFKTALEFVNKIGALAEEQGHHPNINFGWGFVEVTLWTHKINGLHESDFVLAAKIEQIKI